MTWCWLWLFNCCRGLGDCEVHMWWRLVPRQGQTSHRQEQRQQDGAGSPLHRLRKLGDCGVGQVRRIGRDSFSYLVGTKMMAVDTSFIQGNDQFNTERHVLYVSSWTLSYLNLSSHKYEWLRSVCWIYDIAEKKSKCFDLGLRFTCTCNRLVHKNYNLLVDGKSPFLCNE